MIVQVTQARHRLTCVRNEPGTDQLADHDRQVGGDGHHAVLQVVVQLSTVVCDLDHLRKKIRGVDLQGVVELGREGVCFALGVLATVQMR